MVRHRVPFGPGLSVSAAWLGVVLLAACAPAGPSLPPLAVAASSGQVRFDGIYQGSRVPEGGCGFAEQVEYAVAGGSISQRGRGDVHVLDGVIGTTGRFQLTNPAGDRTVSGAIDGDHLTGTETSPPIHHKHQRSYVEIPDADCHARIDARRVAAPAAGPAG